MSDWLLLQTKPHKEEFIASEINYRQINCFCPKITKQNKDRRRKKAAPYFPGYLFVKVEPGSQHAHELKWLPGVVGWVSFGMEPASLEEKEIDIIRRKVEVFNEENKNRSAAIPRNTRVRISEGPFAGYEGLFDTHISGTDRVRILLKLVRSQQKKVDLPLTMLRVMQ